MREVVGQLFGCCITSGISNNESFSGGVCRK